MSDSPESAVPTVRACFVISQIGSEGSEERAHADKVLEFIIRPVLEVEPFCYEVTRADTISDPGMVSSQVITSVLDADLVVADLTGHNPNAFYELALRHMANKPAIHMIERGEKIPFDNQDVRTAFYSLWDPKTIEQSKRDLKEFASAIDQGGYTVSNPVTTARGVQRLDQSADDGDRLMGQLVRRLGVLEKKLDGSAERQGRFELSREGKWMRDWPYKRGIHARVIEVLDNGDNSQTVLYEDGTERIQYEED